MNINLKRIYQWQILSFVICLFNINYLATAQDLDKKNFETNPQTKAEIEKAVLGYIENFFENNTEEMLKYLHPKLAKRGLSKKRGESTLFFEDMSIDELKNMLSKKPPLSKAEQENKVFILDIFYNTASVRLETGYPNRMKWIEYIHLSKLDNQWLISNVIWDYYPRKKKSIK